jgi:hypothetical protein
MGPDILSTDHGQPLGSHIDLADPTGYYIDMRVKAYSPSWPQSWFDPAAADFLWVGVTQLGLGFHERYVAGDGDQWLDAALAIANALVSTQETAGAQRGGWVHRFPLTHTFDVVPPWLCGMAQGEAASLLVRLAKLTSDERFADAAREAMRPLRLSSADGGVLAQLNGGAFFEEYPTDPPSFVLNGGLFALWGCYDVAIVLGDENAGRLFDDGTRTLVENIDRYDTGYWSRYDLFPHRLVNVASLAYHRLHVDQLRAMALVSGNGVFDDVATRFEGYRASRLDVANAMARKVAFRIAVPRRRG